MKRLFGLIAVVALVLAVGAPGAAATPRPKMRWESIRTAHVGEPIELSWMLDSLVELKGSRILVQEARAKGGYRTIRNLGEPTGGDLGDATLPAHDVLGQYRYRLVVMLKGKMITQTKETVRVFGRVPLAVLFANQRSWGRGGAYSFPGGRFKYVASVPIPAAAETTLFTVGPDHCTAIHMNFVLGGPEPTIRLIDPQGGEVWDAVTAPGDTVKTLEGTYLIKQPWSVVAKPQGEGGFPTSLYLNGWASCDSKEPF
jgi:hypothetical protein